MAFIDGPSLNKWIAGNPLDARGIGKLVYKLALAMQAAHDGGVIHRDLKPGNVAVDKKGEPIVLDFGLAKLVDARSQPTRPGAVFGTLTHMAPEQARGQTDAIGPATDVYALGVILYELLTGELPFIGPPEIILAQLLAATPRAPRKINPDVPEALEKICLKALAKKPEERFASMKALADALARAVRGLAGTAKTAPVPRPLPEGKKVTRPDAGQAATLPPTLPTAPARRGRGSGPARGSALGLTLFVFFWAGLVLLLSLLAGLLLILALVEPGFVLWLTLLALILAGLLMSKRGYRIYRGWDKKRAATPRHSGGIATSRVIAGAAGCLVGIFIADLPLVVYQRGDLLAGPAFIALIVGIGIITMCLGFVVWRRINVGAACVLVGIVIVGYSGSSEIYPRAIVFGLLTAGIGFVICGGDPGF